MTELTLRKSYGEKAFDWGLQGGHCLRGGLCQAFSLPISAPPSPLQEGEQMGLQPSLSAESVVL